MDASFTVTYVSFLKQFQKDSFTILYVIDKYRSTLFFESIVPWTHRTLLTLPTHSHATETGVDKNEIQQLVLSDPSFLLLKST
jgi:glutathionyl-hydroquinone reductase